MLRLVICLALMTVVGCAGEAAREDKGVESELPVDGAADSLARPTEHGALVDGASATLASSARYHAWTLSVGAEGADVHLETTGGTGRGIDTVMYLYRRQADGRWGTAVARNDDAASSTDLSMISEPLRAGEYRVLVKGYRTATYGNFSLHYACSGVGCASTQLVGEPLYTALQEAARGASWPEVVSLDGFSSETDPQARIEHATSTASAMSETAILGAFTLRTMYGWAGGDAATYTHAYLDTSATNAWLARTETMPAFARLHSVLRANVQDLHIVRIGQRTSRGALQTGAGIYVIFVVGRAADGALVGYRVETVEH